MERRAAADARLTGPHARSPDVAVPYTNLALEVLKPIAGNVPIVFVGVGDPVGGGFVARARPARGNITGFASHEPSMGGKWLEILKAAPHVTQVLAIMHPETHSHQVMWQSVEEAAPRLGVRPPLGRYGRRRHRARYCVLARKPDGGSL